MGWGQKRKETSEPATSLLESKHQAVVLLTTIRPRNPETLPETSTLTSSAHPTWTTTEVQKTSSSFPNSHAACLTPARGSPLFWTHRTDEGCTPWKTSFWSVLEDAPSLGFPKHAVPLATRGSIVAVNIINSGTPLLEASISLIGQGEGCAGWIPTSQSQISSKHSRHS